MKGEAVTTASDKCGCMWSCEISPGILVGDTPICSGDAKILGAGLLGIFIIFGIISYFKE
jgi:hypothetical protein